MLWRLHSSGLEWNAELRDHLERRLLFALPRFDQKISKVNIYVADRNGPKGGIDKSCQIIVQMPGFTNVVAKTVDSEWVVCIDRATTRIGQNLLRAFAGKREHRRRPVKCRTWVRFPSRFECVAPQG